MVAMGLVDSWWALLALPAALLIGFAFAGAGMALTTFMKSWQDFEYVQLAIMPMFLFSATFFPVTTYDGLLRWVVEVTPLYRGVVLCRELTHRPAHRGLRCRRWSTSRRWGSVGLMIVSRRLHRLLLS